MVLGDAHAIAEYRRPILFYSLATAIPWCFWFAAALVSRIEPATPPLVLTASLLGLAGLFGPMVVAFGLIFPSHALRADVIARIFNFRASSPVYWLLALGLMPASILLAMAISLRFGYSAAQFHLAEHASFTSGVFPVWFLLIAAPVIEELAWHTYGTDCLRSRFSLVTTCLIFAVFWAVWHVPLAFIKGYYQSNLVATGFWDALNFPISIIPFVIIMNWLYYRASRNIWIAAVFHVTAGYFNELFATNPDSKIIQTGLLLALAGALLVGERRLFFGRLERLAT